LYHADAAEGGGITQADFLNSFPLPRWVKLNNLFEKHLVRRYTATVSLLYILAELNMVNLIRVLGSSNCCLDVEAERYGCPLFAAAAASSEQAVELCMESIQLQQAYSSLFAIVDEQYFQHKSVRCAARRDFVYIKSRGFLPNAAELGHDKLLAHLIASGRFENGSQGSSDANVLWWASKNGCEMSARLLIAVDPAMVNGKDKNGRTPLLIAAELGHPGVIELLLEEGADVSAETGTGDAFHTASYFNRKETVELLLRKGFEINAQSRALGTALQAASHRGHKEIVALLLDKGADVNMNGGFQGTALQAAIARRSIDTIMLLLSKGADINIQSEIHGTALRTAVIHNYKYLVELLLRKGAGINTRSGQGNRTAVEWASLYGYKDIVALLLDKGAEIGYALEEALSQGSKDIADTVQLLLEEGVDVGDALKTASEWGHKEVVTLLREHSKAEPSK
jgi:ankyrin repeat protein